MGTVTINRAVEGTPVAETALLMRVRRFLAKRGEKLVRAHPNERGVTGNWYVVHEETQQITAVGLDLEAVARFLNLLKPYEWVGESDDCR